MRYPLPFIITVLGISAFALTGNVPVLGGTCASDADCNDDDPCTTDVCESDLCQNIPPASGDICYDATADFGEIDDLGPNPNGVWTYAWSPDAATNPQYYLPNVKPAGSYQLQLRGDMV